MSVAFHEKPEYAHFVVTGLATPRELTEAIDVQLAKLAALLAKDVKALNERIHEEKVPFIAVD